MAIGGLILLAGCEENARLDHSMDAIPNDTLGLMQEKGVTADAPILIRSYKQESELEVWKRRPDGRYTYLKTFPMCRWSGQLGPKMREGDRQAPEGFYSITPGQLNPNSNYYLSFNVGYPNAYDRAHGASGGHIMVHGICSSSGCFSMTNQQMGEIYALVREAFNGGQHEIQMQSMPFRMTPKNLAKHRFDPNIEFWRNLKQGVDNFEVTKQEPIVGVCNKHYVFNATPANGGHFDAISACPKLREDEGVKADVAAKQKRDDTQVAALVEKGERPVQLVYVDGGQHPTFYGQVATSRPEGLYNGPTEVVMDDTLPAKRSKSAKSTTMIAKADEPRSKAEKSRVAAVPAPVDTQPTSAIAAVAPAPAASDQPLYSRMLGYTATTLGMGGSDEPRPAPATAPADPQVAQPQTAQPDEKAPAEGRHAAASKPGPQAHAKRKPHRDDVANIIDGAAAPVGKEYMALSPPADH